jgi:membrane protease YdiL (CAAX protease family)
MDPVADDPWLIGLVNLVVVGSAGAWVWIIWRWHRHGEVLPYEPRRPAPWGPAAALLAVAMAILAVSSVLKPAAIEHAAHKPGLEPIAVKIAAFIISQLLLVGGFFVVIVHAYRASAKDLGLPRSANEALRDVVIGAVACFAALIPVRIAQGLLLWLMGREEELSQNPLIETLTSSGAVDNWVMLLAGVSAVIVAPICEEIAFRLLFQGWLENWEDERSKWRAAAAVSTVHDANSGNAFIDLENPEAGVTDDRIPNIPSPSSVTDESSFSLEQPPHHGLFGLPYGWFPILVSSLLFGIAHAGYGPEPVPLFLFGLFLGYIFQRTNRILACIVAHALFNFVSMLALWRIILHAAD